MRLDICQKAPFSLRWTSKKLRKRKLKSFPSHNSPWGGADLRFLSPKPDTCLHCKTTG